MKYLNHYRFETFRIVPIISILLIHQLSVVLAFDNSYYDTLLSNRNDYLQLLRSDSSELRLPLEGPDLECGINWPYTYSLIHNDVIRFKRVAYGDPTIQGEIPWFARIKYNETISSRCAGVIIDERHILTVAHCLAVCDQNTAKIVSRPPAHELKVWIGDYYLSETDGEKQVYVEKVMIHKDFCTNKDTITEFDIGLLRLKEPIKFKLEERGRGSVNRICLPSQNAIYSAGQRLMSAGFGVTEERETPDNLLKVAMVAITTEDCNSKWNKYFKSLKFTRDKHICTSEEQNHTMCMGDSGAPLFGYPTSNEARLIGIASSPFNTECATNDLPNVFTMIVPYLQWIKENIASSR